MRESLPAAYVKILIEKFTAALPERTPASVQNAASPGARMARLDSWYGALTRR